MAITTINLSSLDGSNGFRLDGVNSGERLGFSVSNAGDVNGDGFDDVIIGAPLADPNGSESGASYVVFGRASGFNPVLDLSSLNGNTGFRVDGATTYDRSGRSVSGAGDVNGDGFDDLIVGARLTDQNGYSYGYSNGAGASYVVFGKASGFSAALNLSDLDGSNGFRLDGKLAYSASGHSVSNAGDVNGDGFDDLIVGAPDPIAMVPEDEYLRSGDSYVIFGKASGFSAALDLSSLDGSTGFHLDGVSGDHLGNSVSSAGDVNGDGFADVIVGAAGYASPNGHYSGSSYVVFGQATGFAATLDLSSLDGTNGFRLDGAAGDHLGNSVSSAGDVNGDGFTDVIVGAPYADPNGEFSGSSYVVFGQASGFSATLNLSSLDGSNGFRVDGAVAQDFSGISLSSAGDVNGDGFDDLIIGATGTTNPNGNGSGSSYVVFGKAAGFSATLNLSSLNNSNGFRLDGEAVRDFSGSSVSSAGDVNGDGFDDLIVGARYADPNGDYSGSSYVIFGRSDFTGDVIEGTSGDDTLQGTPGADVFEAGDGNDTILGLGGADVFHAGTGNDDIKISDLDFGLVDGGTGDDVLHLAGSGLNLDVASFDGKISGIETICFYGTGDNSLTLTAEDVLSLSDTTNILKVNGNTGDRIVGMSSGWTDGGIGPQGYFHTYTQGDAVLLVGMNVTTDFA